MVCHSLGPSGAGKSTSAQLFGRSHGYIYYEADCFMHQVNPFVDLNASDPTMEQGAQTPLKVRIQKNKPEILSAFKRKPGALILQC